MRRRPAVVFGTSLAAAGALLFMDACTIINGLTVPEDGAASDAPGQVDGGDAGLEDTGCHFVPPARPSSGDDPPNDKVVVAVVKQFLLSNPTGPAAGFDLDNACSGQESEPESCSSAMAHPDPDGGIDNTASDIFNLVSERTDLETRVNKGILEGSQSILLRVGGYNGKPDDPVVTVSIFASPGLFDPPDGTVNKPPQFLSTEQWALDEAQFIPLSPDLPTATAQGWVRGGTVVAYLSGATAIALSANFSVTLTGAVVTATLDLSGPEPLITGGVIAGRWPATDILRVVSRQRTSDGGAPLCDDAQKATFTFVKINVCAAADIREERTSDNKGEKCDAISAGLRFLAARGGLGPKRPVVPDMDCPAGYDAGGCQ